MERISIFLIHLLKKVKLNLHFFDIWHPRISIFLILTAPNLHFLDTYGPQSPFS